MGTIKSLGKLRTVPLFHIAQLRVGIDQGQISRTLTRLEALDFALKGKPNIDHHQEVLDIGREAKESFSSARGTQGVLESQQRALVEVSDPEVEVSKSGQQKALRSDPFVFCPDHFNGVHIPAQQHAVHKSAGGRWHAGVGRRSIQLGRPAVICQSEHHVPRYPDLVVGVLKPLEALGSDSVGKPPEHVGQAAFATVNAKHFVARAKSGRQLDK